MKHLIFSEWLGTQEVASAVPAVNAKPIALTANGQVVYSTFEPRDLVSKLAKFNLVRYTPEIQKDRRALAETVLGYYAITLSDHAKEAVDKVSLGIRAYWNDRRKQLLSVKSQGPEFVAVQSDKYLAGPTSFGRLNMSAAKTWAEKVDVWMTALDRTPRDLPKIMNIHDNFYRILRILGPADLDVAEIRWVRPMSAEMKQGIADIVANTKISVMTNYTVPQMQKDSNVSKDQIQAFQKRTMEDAEEIRKIRADQAKDESRRTDLLRKQIGKSWDWMRSPVYARGHATAEMVRPKSLFDESFRGRKAKDSKPSATRTPGLLSDDSKVKPALAVERLGLTLDGMKTPEDRVRGMDLFIPEVATMSPEFAESLRQFNLNFGAGPSGTTGTLFAAARAFGDITGDELKKYLLGCVAYLVGGGMHTCHEVFTTFNLLFAQGQGPYQNAKYDGCLPLKFRTTRQYTDWKAEFHDIAG